MSDVKFTWALSCYKSLADSLINDYDCKCGSPPYTDGLMCAVCRALMMTDELNKLKAVPPNRLFKLSQLKNRLTPDKPAVYVSSKVRHADTWWRYQRNGTNIISSWIQEEVPEEIDFERLWAVIELEVPAADVLVLYAMPEDFPLLGALIEVGMALAANKPVIVVAPDVKLNGATCRPFGSWVKHKNVHFADNLDKVMLDLQTGIPAGITPVTWSKNNANWRVRIEKKNQLQRKLGEGQ